MSSTTIERFAGWLSTVERYFAGSVPILMTGLYALNIFVRTAFPTFASSFAWIDEAARYMMVWVVFITAGIALEVGRHVSVNIAHDYMPPGLLSPLFKVIDVENILRVALQGFVAALVVGRPVGLAAAHVVEKDYPIVVLERRGDEAPHRLVAAEAVGEEHHLLAAAVDGHMVPLADRLVRLHTRLIMIVAAAGDEA